MCDLGFFNLDTATDVNMDITQQSIRTQYYSPYKFAEVANKNPQIKNFSVLHNNVRSLKRNLENSQIQLLQELDYNFNVIGVTETKIRDNTFNDFNPELVNYQFEFVPTPLALGGVGMYIRDDLRYTVLEKC